MSVKTQRCHEGMDFGLENIDIACFSESLTHLALLLSKLCKQQPVYLSQGLHSYILISKNLTGLNNKHLISFFTMPLVFCVGFA